MRNLLALLGAGVVTFLVVGWFLGWYQVKATPGKDGQTQVHINLNGEKIRADIEKGRAKLLGLIDVAHYQAAPQSVAAPPEFPPLPTPPSLPPLATPPAPGNAGTMYHESGTWVYPPR